MMQLPPAPLDTPSIRIPVPSGLEQWRAMHDVGEKLLLFLALAVLLYLLARFARRQASRHIEEVNRRHQIRKWINYGYIFLLVLIGIALFADALERLGTILALIVAGLAVALQDVVKSAVAWLYISSRSGVQVGSRVEVEGVMGDVIDIGVLKTTLLEVGNRVFGEQSTGRVVTVPNYRMLSATVFLSAAYNPFVWQEVRVMVTFESDWERAEEILYAVAEEIHAEVAPDLQRGFGALQRRFAFKYGKTTPIVYTSLAPSGVQLTLRFLIHVRRQRGGVDRVSRQVLRAFAAEPNIRLAYPTYRIYRAGEEGGGAE